MSKFKWHHAAYRVRGSRVRCIDGCRCPGRANAALHRRQQQGPPAGAGCGEVRRARRQEQRRQDQDPGVSRRHARTRPASGLRHAGRDHRPQRHEREPPRRQREGDGDPRLPVPVQQRGRRPTRSSTARSARSSWTSCPSAVWSGWPTGTWGSARCTQRQEADHQGGRSQGPQDARHPDADLCRLHERNGCERGPHALHRDVLGAGAGVDRRHDQSAAQYPRRQVQRGHQEPHHDQPHVHAADRDRRARGHGTSCRRPTRRSCATRRSRPRRTSARSRGTKPPRCSTWRRRRA